MGKIYALRNDYTKYQDLDLELWDIVRHTPDDIPLDDVNDFSIRNISFKTWWPNPDTRFNKNVGFENAKIPDLSHWTNGTLVLSPKSHRLLGELLAQSGELLPVTVGTDTYYIYNCFVFGEEDKNKTQFSELNGEPFELLSLGFTAETSNKLLFKSESENCVTLFCGEQFKQLTEEYGLTGLEFSEQLILDF